MPGELVMFTRSLNEEEQRHVLEQLTDVELATERSELRLGKLPSQLFMDIVRTWG
jgi:hypothetical protein